MLILNSIRLCIGCILQRTKCNQLHYLSDFVNKIRIGEYVFPCGYSYFVYSMRSAFDDVIKKESVECSAGNNNLYVFAFVDMITCVQPNAECLNECRMPSEAPLKSFAVRTAHSLNSINK